MGNSICKARGERCYTWEATGALSGCVGNNGLAQSMTAFPGMNHSSLGHTCAACLGLYTCVAGMDISVCSIFLFVCF